MAIKFWFGKTGAEPGGATEGPSASVPSESSMPKDVPAAQSVGPSGDASVLPSLESKVELAEPEKAPDDKQKPASGDAGTGGGTASGSSETAAPATAKIVLKAVGGGGRLAAAQPSAASGVAVPKAPVPAAGAPAQPMVFGLRPKAGTPSPAPAEAAVSAAPAAGAEAKKGAVERDADETIVRPKTDQRALYYQLMNGLYDAMLILDDQGHVVDCSTRVEEMLGYSREDAWDLPIGKIIPGMSSQMFEHLKRNLAENHHILIDARCVRKDGSAFSSEVGVSTLSLTRGNNMVFAIRNVERRKSAIEDLRKSRAALEVALVPAFVCDPDGFFLMVNQSLLEAFGIPDEAQAKSVRFMDLLPDAARFFLRAACGEKLREKMQVPTPGGVPVKLELSLLPVQNGQTVTAVAGSILQM